MWKTQYGNLTFVNPSSDKSMIFPAVMVSLLCDLNIISRMSLLSLGFKSYHIDLYAASLIILLWRRVLQRCRIVRMRLMYKSISHIKNRYQYKTSFKVSDSLDIVFLLKLSLWIIVFAFSSRNCKVLCYWLKLYLICKKASLKKAHVRNIYVIVVDTS